MSGKNRGMQRQPPIDRSTIQPYREGKPGEFYYSRNAHPTGVEAERALGVLDGGHALLFSSGAAAVATAVLALLEPGKTVAIAEGCYYGTGALFRWLSRWGLRCVEFDQTGAPPAGADLVLHSATKYLGGHHDALLGALVCRSEDDLARVKELRGLSGPIAAPDSAWLVLRGLKTLELRVRRQSETALELARRLAEHAAVERVRYPGLGPDPLAARYMDGGFGGLLSFDVRGDARRVETSTRLIANATSLGGVDSVLETRHRWEGDRVPRNLIRLSVGLEDVEALWADLEQALATA